MDMSIDLGFIIPNVTDMNIIYSEEGIKSLKFELDGGINDVI